MVNEILSYFEMCRREGSSLQRGMNFGLGSWYSVVLMSVRENAPYRDRFEEEGTVLIYEGHDERRRSGQHDPKPYHSLGSQTGGLETGRRALR